MQCGHSFSTNHGKLVCDGRGGVVKSRAANVSSHRPLSYYARLVHNRSAKISFF